MTLLAAVPAEVKVDWASLWLNMGGLDVVFLLVFGFGVFLGLRQGLAKAIFGLVEALHILFHGY